MNNKIELYKNNTLLHRFYFYNLLDGLVWVIKNNVDFDYMIVDEDTRVKFYELRRYFVTINDYYKRVYGIHYELEEVFV